MSKSVSIALGVSIGLGAILLLTPRPGLVQPKPTAAPTSGTGAPPAMAAGRPAIRGPAAPATAGSQSSVVDLPETVAGATARIQVRADRVLAKVNGNPIALKDLLPIEPTESERTMTREEYESRLNRAIEMELTIQAAAAQGVSLNVEQQARVDGLAQKHEGALAEMKGLGITWSSATPAQVQFEKRVISSLLLQQNLVAKAARSAPSADAAAQARYEEARREMLAGWRARGEVSLSAAP